ncbi:MAG: hypothetical protein FWG67_08125 [Defluviitaleaceae bacterium]|nr:hypothetical protein [Defluviitaleaceae bacterium]
MNKKMLIVSLVVVMLFSLLGIGYAIVRPRLPEWTVGQMMAQLETLELDELALELTDGQEALFRALWDIYFDELSYEITGSTIQGSMAYVNMELTVVDLPRLVTHNHKILLANMWSNLGSLFATALNDGFEEVLIQGLLTLLEDDDIEMITTTQAIEIPLEREGLLWVPIFTDELLLSMLGLNDQLIAILDDLIN